MFKFCYSLFILVYICTICQTQDGDIVTSVMRRNKSSYLNYAGKIYYFGTIFKANYFQSLQFCRQQGMQLVSITTPRENERLGKFAQEIGFPLVHFWTSGANLGDKSQWIWLATGSKIVYTNWHPGEPSGKSISGAEENCLEFRDAGVGFTWNDRVCDDSDYFICESSADCDSK